LILLCIDRKLENIIVPIFNSGSIKIERGYKMKKKKTKGFTLIELLAIIVILAIIAVITVPIILNVIDNAKIGAAKDSAYGYKDAINKFYVSQLYDNPDLKLDGTYTITEKGELSDGTNVYEIPFTGATPKGGSLTYENNSLTSGCITMDEYKTTIENGEVTTVEKGSCGEQQVTYKCIRATELHKEQCTQNNLGYYCSFEPGYTGKEIEYGGLGSGDELVSGDAFDCDVNGDGTYDQETERFYYVSDLYIGNNNETNELEFDSDYAVLIYYNNTSIDGNGNIVPDNTSSSLISYDSTQGSGVNENWHGPLTAINNLPTINDWSNVSLSSTSRGITTEIGTTSTSGGTLPQSFSYTKTIAGKTVPLAARLLTYQEVATACGGDGDPTSSGELNGCNYLLENTKYTNSSLGVGYWLETPRSSSYNSVMHVNSFSRYVTGADSASMSTTTDEFYISLRPAIEVLKTDIEL